MAGALSVSQPEREPVHSLIDSHCHLDVAAFDDDRDAVVERARQAGVARILIPAIRPSTWDRLLELAAVIPEARVALGIHPQIVPALDDAERNALDTLAARLAAAGAVAVGECGLDGKTGDHDEQERIFAAQIAIARELSLPLVVHVLNAHDVAPRLMAAARAHEVGGVMHSYSGGADLVPIYRDLGFAFSFAGPVTYANSRRPLAAARAVPDDLLLAETDAPDQSPLPHRGRRSEPAFVVEIAAALARARGVDEESLARLTTANAHRVFKLQ